MKKKYLLPVTPIILDLLLLTATTICCHISDLIFKTRMSRSILLTYCILNTISIGQKFHEPSRYFSGFEYTCNGNLFQN